MSDYTGTDVQEAIRRWLLERGFATRYSPKKWSIKADTWHPRPHTVIIKTMGDAIRFYASQPNTAPKFKVKLQPRK